MDDHDDDDDDINISRNFSNGNGNDSEPTTLPGAAITSTTTTAITTIATAANTKTMPMTAAPTESAADTSTATNTSSAANNNPSPMTTIAPEIPRWRFVAKAKKTEGYSSHAAGTVVQGLSAEELAGRYNNSNWRRNVITRDEISEDERIERKDSIDEGMLEVHHDERKIGKLNLTEASNDDKVMLNYHAGREKRRIKDGSDNDATNDDSNDEDYHAAQHHLLPLHPVLTAETDNDSRLDQVERQEPAVVEQQVQDELTEVEKDEYSVSKQSEECKVNIASSPALLLPRSIEELPESDVAKQSQHSKTLKWTMAFILLVSLLAIILGVTLGGSGGRKSTVVDINIASDEGAVPTIVPSYSSSPTQQLLQLQRQQPTSMPTILPSRDTSLFVSQKPTEAMVTISPTSLPQTDLPTTSIIPSLSPTLQPTCETNYNDFNLCIALDMSGSVCNGNTGFECYSCEPETICLESISGGVGEDKTICCTNFYEVIEFSKLIIRSLEILPVTQSYSLVSFGNNATLDLDLASPEDMLVALDGLIYTGGKTNHADAISACHTSLISSTEITRKNIMLLITDGYPSEPKNMPKESAEVAATEAKSDGVFIIPIAIQLQFSPEPTPYLQSISSDGTVFDVSDFDLLDDIEEDLFAQVSCQV